MTTMHERGLGAPILVLLALIAVGAVAVLANRSLPLVQDSLAYARASESVIENGYDPRPVVADSALSYEKPILYAWGSAPLVRALGTHDGLRVSSFLGNVAYLLAAAYFARTFARLLPPRGGGVFLWLCALGPCVVYQFWSAHPGGAFAALVLCAWSLTERIVAQPRRWSRVVWWGAAAYAAILLEGYALILLASCPLYVVCNWRRVRQAGAGGVRALVAGVFVVGAIACLAALAWKGWHPLARFDGEVGGLRQYRTSALAASVKGAWIQLALAVALQFSFALVLALRRAAWGRELALPLVCFAGVYVLGLMPFPTTFFNMRHFVPLFPLAALVLVRGAASCAPAARRALLVAHAITGCALVLVFNCAPVYRALEPVIPSCEVEWIGPRLSLLDNLRMKQHVEQKALLDHIDAALPHGAKLYWMDVVYSRDAQHGVYEQAGLVRADIATQYVSRTDFHPSERSFFVWSYWPKAPPLDAFGRVTELGRSLYRVDARD
ncbi:MAG: hypothetical protein ACKVWV_05300 [Planctomycetota bacterium]